MIPIDTSLQESFDPGLAGFSTSDFWQSRASRAGLSYNEEPIKNHDAELSSAPGLNSESLTVNTGTYHHAVGEQPGLLTAIMMKTPRRVTEMASESIDGPLTALMLRSSAEESEFNSIITQSYPCAGSPYTFGVPDSLPNALIEQGTMYNPEALVAQGALYSSDMIAGGDHMDTAVALQTSMLHGPTYSGLAHEPSHISAPPNQESGSRAQQDETMGAPYTVPKVDAETNFMAIAVRDVDRVFTTQAMTRSVMKYLSTLPRNTKKVKRGGPGQWGLFLQECLQRSRSGTPESGDHMCPFTGCAFNEFGLHTPEDLAKHVSHSHWTRRHSCVWCSQQFSRSDAVVRHTKKTHGEEERMEIMKTRVQNFLQLVRLGLAIGSAELDNSMKEFVIQMLNMHRSDDCARDPTGEPDEEEEGLPPSSPLVDAPKYTAETTVEEDEAPVLRTWQRFREKEIAQNVSLNAVLATNQSREHISDLLSGTSDHWIDNCNTLMHETGNKPKESMLQHILNAKKRARKIEAQKKMIMMIEPRRARKHPRL